VQRSVRSKKGRGGRREGGVRYNSIYSVHLFSCVKGRGGGLSPGERKVFKAPSSSLIMKEGGGLSNDGGGFIATAG